MARYFFHLHKGHVMIDHEGTDLGDPDEARKQAIVAAGEMLINGRGGPPDKDVAMALFVRAAAAGHPGALLALELLSDPKPQAPPCVRRLAA